jgi:GNAT superfamily N-acetyltransferase
MLDIVAFPQWHRYPFYYLPNAYLSDRLGQVVALLGHNGYHRVHGEVYMDWPNYRPPDPCPAAVAVDLSVTWLEGRGALPGLLVRAYQGSKHVATCECISCADNAEGDVAQDWAFTKWVGVAEELRGQGLGRYLLQQALCEMHRAGYRHAAISTAWPNYRAALFYTNLGYQVVDWTYAYGRALEPHRVPFS